MNPQEKSLIDSVFDRLAQGATGTKDASALAHIQDHVAKQPDSTYGLVQAVLVQEMGLNQASARIAELERQLAQGGQAQGSGFLGNVGPWGRAATAVPAQPQMQPQPQPSAGPWGSAQPAGGGFLHNMMGMAAGVAAGSLLADGIASLFGGRHMFGGGFGGIGGGMGPWGGSPGMVENVTVNNYGVTDGTGAVEQDASLTEGAAYQDASFDPSADDGGGSFDDGGGFDSSDI